MQYDLDIRSDQSTLFLQLRSVILSFDTIREKKNPKQTTYYDTLSTVCMLRVRKGKVRLSFANVAKMKERFSELLGDAKIVRYIEFSTLDDVDSGQIKEMIEESLLLNIEKAAIRELRKNT